MAVVVRGHTLESFGDGLKGFCGPGLSRDDEVGLLGLWHCTAFRAVCFAVYIACLRCGGHAL